LQVSTLVVAEHKGDTLGGDTLCTINAAAKLGGDISLLLAGQGVQKAAESAAKAQGVKQVWNIACLISKGCSTRRDLCLTDSPVLMMAQVLTADDDSLGKATAERLAALVVAVQHRYD
jgi:electron transfer flavoprotein alpha subunit